MGHELREEVLIAQFKHSFFLPVEETMVWIHMKGKAIFIKEVPTLPLQTDHSWLVLQLQLYQEGGSIKTSIEHIISF